MGLQVILSRRQWFSLGLILCVVVLACEPKGKTRVQPTQLPPPQSDMWVLRPVRMRVYPLTRYVHTPQQTILDAKIELFDEMGDSVKGVGQFRLELFVSEAAGDDAVGERLYQWDIPMQTLQDQRQCYDAITRTYRFRLKLDGRQAPHSGTSLRVVFITPNGERLEAQMDLSGKA